MAEEQRPVFGPVTPAEAAGDWKPDTPLFMSELDESNDLVQALEELKKDSTPQERADGYKEEGNDYFKAGVYVHALDFYTRAIEEKGVESATSRSVYYANRAIVHIKLQNYGKAVADCKEAIELDRENMKAHHRLVTALLALRKHAECIEACRAALEVKPKLKTILKLREEAEAKLQAEESKRAQQEASKAAVNSAKREVEDAIAARGIVCGSRLFAIPSSHYKKPLKLKEGVLYWPVMFLYPKSMQSDFIESCDERTTFLDHLRVMFPNKGCVEWDVEQEYVYNQLEVYLQTNAVDLPNKKNYRPQRWVQIDPSKTILEALQVEEHIIPEHLPVFHVIPKTAREFKKEFLTNA